MVDLKNHTTTAVNSVTQDILLLVWDEFSYRLDVIRAAGGGTLDIYKLYCEYNQIYGYITSYFSVVLYLTYRLTSTQEVFTSSIFDI
jgi:hypothetical protein